MTILTTITTRLRMSDGASLFVKVLGNSPEKPLLIVHHGAPGLSSHKEPEDSFGFLADHFRVLVFDARGSGTSDLKPPYTHQRWVADLDELRTWAKADQFHLAGGSYGGFIALEYAVAQPSRLLSLTLRDTWCYGIWGMMNCLKSVLSSPRIKPDPERQLRVWTGTVKDNDEFLAAYKEILPLYTPPDRSMIGVHESFSRTRPLSQGQSEADLNLHFATHNAAFSQNQPRFDLRARLQAIEAPTLVVVGRHDVIAPVMCAEEIVEGILNAELAVFEHSGHSPPSDEPHEFRTRIRRFLLPLIK